MADNNQQYKWRQRKKRNARITVWIIIVILLSAGGTFAYEGLKESNPRAVAEKYIKDTVGVENFTVETGERSLTPENQFVQDYTFTYTADGGEVSRKVSLIQENKKKYGIFDQWKLQPAGAGLTDMELIAPAGSQVLIDGAAPPKDAAVQDEELSPGVVRYRLTGVDPQAKLQINGLPFESYEGTLETDGTVLDARNLLKVSENAKTQMEETGKSMIRELFSAIISGKDESELSDAFAQVPNRDNLYRVLSDNLYSGDELLAESISFEDFRPEFGEIYYPGRDEEAFVGMEMKLSYTCSYEPAERETEDAGETETSEAETGETKQTETETGDEAKNAQKEAVFYFKYQNGACTVTSAEVPGVIG